MDSRELVEWQIIYKLEMEEQNEINTRAELDKTALQNAENLRK